MVRIFIYGNYGYGNLADDIILETLIEDIEKKVPGKKEYIVACVDPKDIVLSDHILKKLKLVKANEFPIPFRTINEINKSDVFIIGGAPHLNGTPNLLRELPRLFAATLLKKKAYVWGIENYDYNKPIMRFLVRKMLADVALITVRDDKSYNRFKEVGLKCKFVRCMDPVLHWKPPKKDYKGLLKKLKVNPKKPIISFYPRIKAGWPRLYNFIGKKGILKENLDKEPERAKKTAGLIDMIVDKTGGQVLIVAEEFFDEKCISDISMLKKIYSFSKRKKNIILVNRKLKPGEFKYIIQKSTMIVSERLHPVIMSRDTYVPAIGIGEIYAKIDEVMKDIGLGDNMIHLKEGNEKKNNKIVFNTFKNRNKIKKKLKKDFPRILKLSDKNNLIIEDIARFEPLKHRPNILKKLYLYLIFLIANIWTCCINLKLFIKTRFIQRKKILYLKLKNLE